MKLPIVIKIILNILFFSIYVVLATVIITMLLGKFVGTIYEPTSSYIQLGLGLLILFITVIFRKYFYISCNKEEL